MAEQTNQIEYSKDAIDITYYQDFNKFHIPTTDFDLSVEQIKHILKTQDMSYVPELSNVSFDYFVNQWLFAHILKFDHHDETILYIQTRRSGKHIYNIDMNFCVHVHNNFDTFDYYGLKFEEVYRNGGCEGEGEHVEIVYSLKVDNDHTCYLAMYGYYNSEDGRDFSGAKFFVVEPYIYTEVRYK